MATNKNTQISNTISASTFFTMFPLVAFSLKKFRANITSVNAIIPTVAILAFIDDFAAMPVTVMQVLLQTAHQRNIPLAFA